MISERDDPHAVLEKLHQRWSIATEATEAAWQALKADSLNQELRDEYYEKQAISNQACQDILVHKAQKGV